MRRIRSWLESGVWGVVSGAVLMLTLASVPALREKTYLAALWNLRHTVLQWSGAHLFPVIVRFVALLAPIGLVTLAGRFLYQQFLPLRAYRQKLARDLDKSAATGGSLRTFYVRLRGTLRSNPHNEIYADALFDHAKTALILGGPGAGKTTSLMNIGLNMTRSESSQQKMTPIFLRLRRFDPLDGLLTLAEETLREYAVSNPSRLLVKLATRGQVAFLLDGLDELAPVRRIRAVEAIRSLIRYFSGCAVYVTCRTAEYNHELDDDVQDVLTISPLSAVDIATLLRQLYPGDPKRAEQLSDAIIGTGIADTPQLVQMASMVATQTSRVPSSGTLLVEEFIKSRLDSWDRARQITLSFALTEKVRFLDLLALEMENKGLSGLSRAECVHIAEAVATETGTSYRADELLTETLRSGLIIELGDHISFAHAVIKDYFLKADLPREIG